MPADHAQQALAGRGFVLTEVHVLPQKMFHRRSQPDRLIEVGIAARFVGANLDQIDVLLIKRPQPSKAVGHLQLIGSMAG